MRILFTSTLDASFIREDLAILRRSFSVDHVVTIGFSSVLSIVREISRVDLTFTWFASVYSFVTVQFGRLFGKKSIVIVGGADAALAGGATAILGVSESVAICAALLIRVATLWFGVLLGALVLLRFEKMFEGGLDPEQSAE